MGRLVVAFALLCAWAPVQGADPPPLARIAIIIDDLGNNAALGRQALALPGQLTYAILPLRPYSREFAAQAHASGREVMLHLPMQSLADRPMGPGGLDLGMDRAHLAAVVRANLDAVPHRAGVNNHMGSRLTQEVRVMRWLMEELAMFGGLYFVDSRTDVRTVARCEAQRAGIAHARRDVFLDNEPEPEAIRAQFAQLVELARRQGGAIGIGHPHAHTLAVLAELLPTLADRRIELVPVSRLVTTERSEKLWHACSSHLPTVAKNSKP